MQHFRGLGFLGTDDKWCQTVRRNKELCYHGAFLSPFVFALKGSFTLIVSCGLMGIFFSFCKAALNHSCCDTKRREVMPHGADSSSSLLMIYSFLDNTRSPVLHISVQKCGRDMLLTDPHTQQEHHSHLMSQNDITFALIGFWIILLKHIAAIQMRTAVWWGHNTHSICSVQCLCDESWEEETWLIAGWDGSK